MAAISMSSCYQAENRFTIEQTDIDRRIERAIFCTESGENGNLPAVEELTGEGDYAVHEIGIDKGAADVAFAGLAGGHVAICEDDVPAFRRANIVTKLVGGEPEYWLQGRRWRTNRFSWPFPSEVGPSYSLVKRLGGWNAASISHPRPRRSIHAYPVDAQGRYG